MHPEVFERAYEKVSTHFENKNQDSKYKDIVFPLDVKTMDGHSLLIFESELNSLQSSFQNGVRRGQSGKIRAIKTLRKWDNVSLKDGKEFIEYLQSVDMLPIDDQY